MKKLFIANWKLNHDRRSAEQFFDAILPILDDTAVEIAIAPVAPMLDFVGRKLEGSSLSLAAQNVFYEEKGAFTGEWSAKNLAELSVKYCIVGHSERRQWFFETDDDVKRKALACLREKICPVTCVGESKEERRNNLTEEVLKREVNAVLEHVGADAGEMVFAYEPLWAIGSKEAARVEEIAMAHRVIRRCIDDALDMSAAKRVRIIYGGSVSAENIKEIVSIADVDGVLVGGASLQASSFLSMVERLQRGSTNPSAAINVK